MGRILKTSSSEEDSAEWLYKQVLRDIIYPLLGKKTTWAKDLTKVGMSLFGNNFTGAHASDMIPNLGVNSDGSKTTNKNINKFSHLYAIVNLDNSTMPGSHWIALSFDVGDFDASGSGRIRKTSGSVWVYDSYGRKTAEIIPSLVQKYGNKLKQVDDDAEQTILEDDCGARSMAWLYVFDRYGVSLAKLI